MADVEGDKHEAGGQPMTLPEAYSPQGEARGEADVQQHIVRVVCLTSIILLPPLDKWVGASIGASHCLLTFTTLVAVSASRRVSLSAIVRAGLELA